MNGFAATSRVMRREFSRIASRPILWGLLIAAPVLLFALIAGVYSRRVVTDIPVAVCDQDRSGLSRQMTRMIESTRSLSIVATFSSAAEIEAAMRSGQVQGGIVFPAGMESDVKAGQSVRVVVYKNTLNLIIGNLIYRDAATMVKTVSGGALLKRLRSGGLGEEQAMGIVNPIRLEVYSLFNPGYNYVNFLVATLLPVMLQMIVMLAAALALNSERAEGTFGQLKAMAGPWPLLFGKALPYIILGSAPLLALLGIVFPLLGIPVAGSLWAAIGLSALFVAASVMPALLISALVRDSQFATEIAVFITTPAFLFSGETFPLRAMPAAYQAVAQLLPSTHFLNGFIKIQLYDAPLAYVSSDAAILSLFVLLPLLVLRWRLPELMHARVHPQTGGASS